MKAHFETALKVGRPVARDAAKQMSGDGKVFVASECPLAGVHILQGIERLDTGDKPRVEHASHPIELFARAYGLTV